MLRFLKYIGRWMVWLSLAVGAQSASAFSMLGPVEAWQTSTLGYWRFYFITLPASGWTVTSDDFAWHPHNLAEESRWNNPVLYYSFDQSFGDYFGSNGVAAVDAAVAVFNSLTNVSSYSLDLHEFPLEESRVNYTAQALHLYDLKSTVMELLIERLGLIDPENWTWAIRARILPPGLACPRFDFAVVQRNFDPVTYEPSRYVNGTLFTYEIEQICPPPFDFGDAVEFPVDPNVELSARFSALASPKLMLPDETFYGWLHTGLTRDDVGGLRYLYASTNLNVEGAGTNTVTFVTDTNAPSLLVTSNLTQLASLSLITNAAGLQALYPGLVVAGEVPFFTNVVTTNIIGYLTNSPYDPAGTPPHLLVTTRIMRTNVQTWYNHAFANVVTNSFLPYGLVTIYTTNITPNPYAPVGGFLTTNVTVQTTLTNMVMGDFYIIPTNSCGVSIYGSQFVDVVSITNTFPSTNLLAGLTNVVSSNAFLATYGAVVSYFTNFYYRYYPVLCVSNSIARRQGIEKVTFIRRDYDSVLRQLYNPVTNDYVLTAVTSNGVPFPQRVQRLVTQPDILFTASDLAGSFPQIPTVTRTTPSFDTTGQQPTLAGPNVIREPVTFTFNKVGPIYVNGTYPLFVDEAGSLLNFAWASYDSSTNAPVIYPSGASIANLENQVFIQILPPYLPDGTNGTPYSAQLQTSAATPNWQAPVSWSLAPGSPGLPPGLGLSPGGLISGTPVLEGFYNFMVQATDAVGRTMLQSYIINVAAHP